MSLNLGDTIAAVATPPGAGGVGIVRISGPDSWHIADRLFVPMRADSPKQEALAVYGKIVDPENDQTLDDVLVIRFRGPRSFTGEDTAEIQAHGGRLNLERILIAVLACGARPATPGEFSLRAFRNGKLDLTQAEAIREIIEAQTPAALNASRRHLEGDVSRLCEELRLLLVDPLAHVEALIDFPEEELPKADIISYGSDLRRAIELLKNAADSYERGRLLHEGAQAMIVGLPNVGKSSLLNRLLRSERAIVTDQPGTTRDLIEGRVALCGVPLSFIDSAGINDRAKGVEAIGVSRVWERIDTADLVLLVIDGSRPVVADEMQLAEKIAQRKGLIVVNKIDLSPIADCSELKKLLPGWPLVSVSALSGKGIDDLEKMTGEILFEGSSDSDDLVLTSARHHRAFAEAGIALQRALSALADAAKAPELVAADLREALSRLEEVIGLTTPEDILDRIFSRFCIGK